MSLGKRIALGAASLLSLAAIVGSIAFLPEITNFLFPEGVREALPSLEGLDAFSGDRISSCSLEKIPYSIGTVDSGFGVSKEVFAEAVKEAESIWENAAGKDIFTPSVSVDRMYVNLVFDERQAKTVELKRRLAGIASAEEKYEAMKNEYQELVSKITPLSDEIDVLKEKYSLMEEDLFVTAGLYESKRDAYEKEVLYWNSRGGAPAPEYERLSIEKSEIDILFNQIKSKEEQYKLLGEEISGKVSSYNELAGQMNTVAGIINRLAESLNAGIASYNRVAADREEFVTGVYRTEGDKRSINIYQFYDYHDLVIIIAHEMGHALGLPHGESEESIMYPKIKSQGAKLSPEDVSLLKSACKQ